MKQKMSGTPNYVGQIRSNLNFEVILEVKKAKKAKSLPFLGAFMNRGWKLFENL